MLQGLIENFLFRSLGSFIQGFNSQEINADLGKGRLALKNLKLKSDLFLDAALPFRIAYSHIGLISLDVPWSRLASESIGVNIEDVYIIINPFESKYWEAMSEYDTKKSLEKTEELINHYLKKASSRLKRKKKNDDSEAQSFKQRQEEKVKHRTSENSKITIKKIHLRIEDKTTKYSGGLTCEEVKVFNVNANGEPQFIDRTLPENQELPLRRKFAIKNLAAYWNASSKDMISESSFPNPLERMKEIIIREGEAKDIDTNYIINVSMDALTTKHKADIDRPAPSIECFLKPLEINATTAQVESIKQLFEFWNSYNAFLTTRAGKLKGLISLESSKDIINEEYISRLTELVHKILTQRKKLRKESKDSQKEILLQQCLESLDIKRLSCILCLLPGRYHAWAVRGAVRLFEKEKATRRLIKEKQANSRSFFDFFTCKKENEVVLTQEEILKIDKDLRRKLAAPEKNSYESFGKDNIVLIISVKNEGAIANYYDDDLKQRESMTISVDKFQSELKVGFKSKNQLYSRKTFDFLLEAEFVSEDLSVSEQCLRFSQGFKKGPQLVEKFIDWVKSKVAENSVSREGKVVTSKLSSSKIHYQNYSGNEDGVIDENKMTAKSILLEKSSISISTISTESTKSDMLSPAN